jgi:hypothetical protein
VMGGAVRITRTADPDLSGNKEPVPNADDPSVLSLGEVEVYTGECPGAMATCDGLTVEGPASGEPGEYTALATSWAFPVYYRFAFSNGKDSPIVVGPQDGPTATVILTEGTWTVTANLGDVPSCISTDPAATCTRELTVISCEDDPEDTHCLGLDVEPPHGGPYPGIFTLTASAADDSGDPIVFTFSASNGIDPPLTIGPGTSEKAAFDLGLGSWTVRVVVGDSVVCLDEGNDAECTRTVEVEPLSLNPNIAPGGVASQSSGYNGDIWPASIAIDGNYDDFTATAPDDPDPWWRVDFIDPVAIDAVKLTNRKDACRSRLRDITVSILDADGNAVWISELLNPENILGGSSVDSGPPALTVSLLALTGGPVVGTAVKIGRKPDPDLSGSGFAGNADEAALVSLGEVEVFGGAGETPLFRRGDADGSGKLDLTDAIFTLQFLFLGGPEPECKDAADADDSGKLDLTDAISSLQFQFMGGPSPPAPGPVNCGPDPTPGEEHAECAYTKC